jgi:protein-tyrosine phosphatase
VNKIKRVIFTCYGNTARSPVAEYLARELKKKYKEELEDIEFSSAGFINAFSYIQPESREYLDSKGIDHSGFTPQTINHELLEMQDLILTMEKSHSLQIIRNYDTIENVEGKTFTLKEFTGEIDNVDIIDPYYTSNETYKKVLKIIDGNVEKAILKIIEINNQG